MEYLEGLNEPQKEAVLADRRPADDYCRCRFRKNKGTHLPDCPFDLSWHRSFSIYWL
jgi:hypothetical protein